MTATGALKFLRAGAVAPFSGHAWPAPRGDGRGAWVAAARDGVFACHPRHLPHWIQEELWEVELAGGIELRRHKLRAERGRLVRRVERWTPSTATAFARSCADRAAQLAAGAPGRQDAPLGMAADADRRARAAEVTDDAHVAAHGGAVCAYIAAMTALRTGGPEAHDAERAWQAGWLSRELELR